MAAVKRLGASKSRLMRSSLLNVISIFSVEDLNLAKNNQFALLNENFRTFATSMQQTTKGIYKMIYGLNKNLVSFLNFQKNNSNLAIKRHTSDNPVTKDRKQFPNIIHNDFFYIKQ